MDFTVFVLKEKITYIHMYNKTGKFGGVFTNTSGDDRGG